MKRIRIVVVALIIAIFLQYLAPCIYAVENEVLDNSEIQNENKKTTNEDNVDDKNANNKNTEVKEQNKELEEIKKEDSNEEIDTTENINELPETEKEESDNSIEEKDEVVEIENVETENIEVEDEKVLFESDTLKEFLLENYDSNQDGRITKNDMSKITKLDFSIYSGEAISLKGLEYATFLEEFVTSENCKDYSVFSNLEKLTSLKIYDNEYPIEKDEYESILKIKNLRKLAINISKNFDWSITDLPRQLEELELRDFNKDITKIEEFTNIQTLSIDGEWQEIEGIENVANLPSLKSLSLSYVSLSDISFLEKAENIENLDLEFNSIKDISTISKLPNVKTLNLKSNQIDSIECLRGNNTIEQLDISANEIRDISALLSMNKLMMVSISGNRIEDISILEDTQLLDDMYACDQYYTYDNMQALQGEKLEIDLPKTIQKCYDENSQFYIEDLVLQNGYGNDLENISINEDGTKLTIDATNLDIGLKENYIYITGVGKLSSTSIRLSYTVCAVADNEKEIEFKSENLKQYLLDNYDIDKDNKITAFDMAQIENLEIYLYQNEIDLQGMEYATSLESLKLYGTYSNYKVLENLPKLKDIKIDSSPLSYEEYETIINLPKLEKVQIYFEDTSNFDFGNLPSNIKEFGITGNITNIKNIEKNMNLTSLILIGNGRNEINNLDVINQLTNLTYLDIENTNLKDISFLENNNTIEKLKIAYNKVEDIKALLTMKNLNEVDISGNQISDVSVYENTSFYDKVIFWNQNYEYDGIRVEKGKEAEIDLPITIQKCFDKNSKFYIEDFGLYDGYGNEPKNIRINEDGTKLIIDATDLDVGIVSEYINIRGNGELSGTSINIGYTVYASADNEKEIEFKDERLKEYLLYNHDIDADGKITAYDMAQITYLYLNPSTEAMSLEGLEYATSLRELQINGKCYNYDVLSKLDNLTSLKIFDNPVDEEAYNSIIKLSNIETLHICLDGSFNYNLDDFPRQIKDLGLIGDMYNGQSKSLNLDNIENFQNLDSLTISYYQEVNGLEKINSLNIKNLTLYNLDIRDIDFLNENATIENLIISYNKLEDVQALLTMKNLQSVEIAGNCIEDLSILENSPVYDKIVDWDWRQNYQFNDVQVEKGKKLEIDLPTTIQKCFDKNSKFYINDIYIGNDENDNLADLTINENGTKLIIDATNANIGTRSEYINIGGDGKLSGTTINVNYTVYENADNQKEIEFESEELKQYLLNNYDVDTDGKITEYDMMQIEALYIENIQMHNSQGLEYAKNLKTLELNIEYESGSNKLDYDFFSLTKLESLKDLYIYGEVFNFDILADLKNLETLSVRSANNNTLENIKNLTNLKRLEIYNMSYEISNINAISNLNKLESLTLEGTFGNLKDFSALKNLKNLKRLIVEKYENYEDTNKIDYSAIANLTNLETLNIKDPNLDLDAKYLSNMTKLWEINLNSINSIINLDYLENCTNLVDIYMNSCRIDNIDFIRYLNKVNYLYVPNNFITDISPIKGKNINYMDFTNNPINTQEETNADTISSISQTQTIRLSDYSKTKGLSFNNKEFKETLIESYDLNKDNEISACEMEQIYNLYLYQGELLENAEYLVNLESLSMGGLNVNTEEQRELISQLEVLESISPDVEIFISGFNVNIGEFKATDKTYEANIEDIIPLIKKMKDENSNIYIPNLEIKIDEYSDEAKLDGNKIILNLDGVGTKYVSITLGTEEQSIYCILEFTVLVEGDTTKEINMADKNLKAELLKNHDANNDGKITEHDMLNLTELDINNKNIYSLEGLQYAKNLETLVAEDNNISDIEPIVKLQKTGWFSLRNNNITDISCLLESKTEEPLNINLYGNYIDLGENTQNYKALVYDLSKNTAERFAMAEVNSVICYQKYGKPENKDKVVNLDEKILNKLISYGIDVNNDGKLTQAELQNAVDVIDYSVGEIDLSRLGLTNVNGLEYLRCNSLNLSNNNLTDITPIAKIKILSSLNISKNKIKDISCFANANNFFWTKIDFSNNSIEDISSISTWPIMKNDTWREWQVGDGLTRDIEIDLSNNNIEDISSVKDWKHLKKLDLSNNKIENIESLNEYNFNCILMNDKYEELLDYFDGIILDYNYINVDNANNQKAIKTFKEKGVTLSLNNQTKLVSSIFKDIKRTDWYYNAVEYTYQRGIISGATETEFRPNAKITRGMIVTILWRMEGSPKVTGVKDFTDVKGQYYYDAVRWAAKNGVVNGYGDGRFGPNANITREQLATILCNYAKYKKKNTNVTVDTSKYKDWNKVSSYARASMQWAIKTGVVTGKENGTKVDPQGTATRGEAACMIYNYCTKIK